MPFVRTRACARLSSHVYTRTRLRSFSLAGVSRNHLMPYLAPRAATRPYPLFLLLFLASRRFALIHFRPPPLPPRQSSFHFSRVLCLSVLQFFCEWFRRGGVVAVNVEIMSRRDTGPLFAVDNRAKSTSDDDKFPIVCARWDCKSFAYSIFLYIYVYSFWTFGAS